MKLAYPQISRGIPGDGGIVDGYALGCSRRSPGTLPVSQRNIQPRRAVLKLLELGMHEIDEALIPLFESPMKVKRGLVMVFLELTGNAR